MTGTKIYHNTSEYIIWRAETRMELQEKHPGWGEAAIDNYLMVLEGNILGNQPEFFYGMAIRHAKSIPELEYDFHLWDLKKKDFRACMVNGAMPAGNGTLLQDCGGLTIGYLDIEVVVTPVALNAKPEYCILLKRENGEWECSCNKGIKPAVDWLAKDWEAQLEKDMALNLAKYADEHGMRFDAPNEPVWRKEKESREFKEAINRSLA